MNIIIKRRGHKEPFDERKLYASIYSACLTTHHRKEDAERMSEAVTKSIKEWLVGKNEVDSGTLFAEAAHELEKLSKDAAFMFVTHRDIS